MAIRVDSLGCAAEHAGSAKPRHRLPASNQCSLNLRKNCCSDRDMDSPRLQLLQSSDQRQFKCIRFEPTFLGDHAVMSGLAWRVLFLSKQPEPTRFEARGWRQAGAARRNRVFCLVESLCQVFVVMLVSFLWRDSHSTLLPIPLSILICWSLDVELLKIEQFEMLIFCKNIAGEVAMTFL